jgi:hypothetical protein
MSVISYTKGTLQNLGVFAYVPSPTITTTTPADTYIPITGPFTNPVIEQFELGVDKIVYTGSEVLTVAISYSGSFTSDTNSTTLTVAVRNGGTVFPGSEAFQKIKLAGDYVSVSGNTVTILNPGDTVQLILKSDKNGAQITVETFTTTLNRFY